MGQNRLTFEERQAIERLNNQHMLTNDDLPIFL